jgi:site-specific DNA-adenine methylase
VKTRTRRTPKVPWPYIGGKSRVARLIWGQLGDVRNYIEPFCGSAAVLLARPTAGRIETINDVNSFVCNAWRAIKEDPAGVAAHADWPVSEADLGARHLWLMASEKAAEFRAKIKQDPGYYDARIAGWWI